MSIVRRDKVNEIDGIKIADNIRAERNRANITIETIEKELNISRPTYIEYEKNAEKVKIGVLIKLALLFDCSVTSFFIRK